MLSRRVPSSFTCSMLGPRAGRRSRSRRAIEGIRPAVSVYPLGVAVLRRGQIVDVVLQARRLWPQIPSRALLAVAVGAVGVGAIAVGSLAVGSLAIGRLRLKEARVERLVVDELTAGRLHRTEPVEAAGAEPAS